MGTVKDQCTTIRESTSGHTLSPSLWGSILKDKGDKVSLQVPSKRVSSLLGSVLVLGKWQEHTDNDLSPETALIISNFMGAREEARMVSHSWKCVCPLWARPLLESQPQATVCAGRLYSERPNSQMSPLTMRCKIRGIHERRSS